MSEDTVVSVRCYSSICKFKVIERPNDIRSMVRSLKSGVYYEFKMLDFIKKRYGTGGTYVDIGAHLGTHSLFFANQCRARRVIAFEPQKDLQECYKFNMQINNTKNVHLFPYGLGKEEKIMWAKGAGYPLEKEEKEQYEKVHIKTFEQCVTSPIPKIKLIKIDTDGMEEDILTSLHLILLRDHPILAVESITEKDFNSVKNILDQYKYKKVGVFNASPTYIWE